MEENICDIGLGKEFLDNNSKIHKRKEEKLIFINIKNLCSSEDLVKRMKDKLQTGRNICKSHI